MRSEGGSECGERPAGGLVWGNNRLHLTNIGPVYRLAAMTSSIRASGWFAARSCTFLGTTLASSAARDMRRRHKSLSGILSTASAGHAATPKSLASTPSSVLVKNHSILEDV